MMRNDDFTGVLLAGGKSSRFGSNKALTRLPDGLLIEYPARVLAELFKNRLLVTNIPDDYGFLGWPMVGDFYPGSGPLAGIHAALKSTSTPYIFVAGCDMPLLDAKLIEYLCGLAGEFDAVVPKTGKGLEPLHAVYSRKIIPFVEENLNRGNRKIHKIFSPLKIREVGETEILSVTSDLNSFRNINTVSDLP